MLLESKKSAACLACDPCIQHYWLLHSCRGLGSIIWALDCWLGTSAGGCLFFCGVRRVSNFLPAAHALGRWQNLVQLLPQLFFHWFFQYGPLHFCTYFARGPKRAPQNPAIRWVPESPKLSYVFTFCSSVLCMSLF